MKLEKAIDYCDYVEEWWFLGRAIQAIRALVDHAKTTRWRKLSEEEPEKEGYYDVWHLRLDTRLARPDMEFWSQSKAQNGWVGFPGLPPTHWRPRVGPKEEANAED